MSVLPAMRQREPRRTAEAVCAVNHLCHHRQRANRPGAEVIVAGNADAAFALLEARTDIHLVFTDIDMPGSMDGLKLAACIRDRWPPIHIIITTGEVRPLEIPANALFIPKPYLAQTVVGAMRAFENM
jgi:DNA-binding LytR/AlgR family response regulator